MKKCNPYGLLSNFKLFLRRHVAIYHSSTSYQVLRMPLLRITFQIHSLFTLFSCDLPLCRSIKYLLTHSRMILVSIFVTTRNTQALLHLSDSNRVPFFKVLTISAFFTHWKRLKSCPRCPRCPRYTKEWNQQFCRDCSLFKIAVSTQRKVLRNLMTLLENSFAFVLEVQFVSRWLPWRDENVHMLLIQESHWSTLATSAAAYYRSKG